MNGLYASDSEANGPSNVMVNLCHFFSSPEIRGVNSLLHSVTRDVTGSTDDLRGTLEYICKGNNCADARSAIKKRGCILDLSFFRIILVVYYYMMSELFIF